VIEQKAVDIQQAPEQAMQHQSAGRIAQAEQMYRQVLQVDPEQAVALQEKPGGC